MTGQKITQNNEDSREKDRNAPEVTVNDLSNTTTATSADDVAAQEEKTMRGGAGSWKELKDNVDVSGGNPRPSVAGIELEERRTGSTTEGTTAGDGGSSSNAANGGGGGHSSKDDNRPRIGADALIHESRHAAHAAAGPDGSTVFYKVYKRRWFGVLQLTLLNIIVSWDWLTFAPVASHSATYFATTENAINWLSIAFMFAFPVVAPLVIYVLHWGPRPSIMAAAVLVLLGNWIRYGGTRSSATGNFGVVMFGQILTGLAQPFVLAAPARYSDLWFTNRGRVAATALMSLANPFGAALGQLIVPLWVSSPGEIPNMVLYVSIIASVGSIPSFFIPAAPPTPVAPSAETPKTSLKGSVRVLASSPEFWMLFLPFSVYVGFFNSISSLLNQIMTPHGYTDDEAGIAGAVLIVVGLVASAIASPIIDRTKGFVASIKIFIPILALCYLAFVWMPGTRSTGGLAGPYVVLAFLGASSFILVPVVVELLVEVTHPVSPEVTSTLAWSGGQILGACFILISDALKSGPDASPPFHMFNALVFTAVIALVAAVPPLCLGLFGRSDRVSLRRVTSDRLAMEARARDRA